MPCPGQAVFTDIDRLSLSQFNACKVLSVSGQAFIHMKNQCHTVICIDFIRVDRIRLGCVLNSNLESFINSEGSHCKTACGHSCGKTESKNLFQHTSFHFLPPLNEMCFVSIIIRRSNSGLLFLSGLQRSRRLIDHLQVVAGREMSI